MRIKRGWGDRALQECNPSTQSSVDCGKSIPAGLGDFQAGFFMAEGMCLQAMASSVKLIVYTADRPLDYLFGLSFLAWVSALLEGGRLRKR